MVESSQETVSDAHEAGSEIPSNDTSHDVAGDSVVIESAAPVVDEKDGESKETTTLIDNEGNTAPVNPPENSSSPVDNEDADGVPPGEESTVPVESGDTKPADSEPAAESQDVENVQTAAAEDVSAAPPSEPEAVEKQEDVAVESLDPASSEPAHVEGTASAPEPAVSRKILTHPSPPSRHVPYVLLALIIIS